MPLPMFRPPLAGEEETAALMRQLGLTGDPAGRGVAAPQFPAGVMAGPVTQFVDDGPDRFPLGLMAGPRTKPAPGQVPVPMPSGPPLGAYSPVGNGLLPPQPPAAAQPPWSPAQFGVAGAMGTAAAAVPPTAPAKPPAAPATATQPPVPQVQAPAAAPFEPRFVPAGRFGDTGAGNWATSPAEEAMARQLDALSRSEQAMPVQYNRFGGVNMDFSPTKQAMIADQARQMMSAAGQANQLSATERGQQRDAEMRASLANQSAQSQSNLAGLDAQTRRDVAAMEGQNRMALGNLDAQTRLGVADKEAASRNNPAMLKAQTLAQMAAAAAQGGMDPGTIAGHTAAMSRAFDSVLGPGATPGGQGGGAGGTASPAGAAINPDNELAASATLNQIAGMIGKGKPGREFQLNPEFGVQDAGKLLDFLAGSKLDPGAMQSVMRQIQGGQLGNQITLRDAILRATAGANYQIQPPRGPDGKPADLKRRGETRNVPPYVIQDAEGELYRYQTDPNANALRAGLGTVYGQLPYGQVALPGGRGVVPIDDSLINPAAWAAKTPRQTLEGRKAIGEQFLRMMMATKPPGQ